MNERDPELERLVAELRERTPVKDAFLAKSFTDQLLVVDVSEDSSLSEETTDRIIECGFRPADSVYADENAGGSFVGDVGDATRHHFLDIRTRGSHHSYVVE
jgi:hypothetical protein